MPSETAQFLITTINRMEEKIDRYINEIGDVKASVIQAVTLINELKLNYTETTKQVSQIQERQQNCSAKKDFETRQHGRKKLAANIAIIATLVTIVSTLVSLGFQHITTNRSPAQNPKSSDRTELPHNHP